jgi:O-antigen/teichoic acid export membrane protein
MVLVLLFIPAAWSSAIFPVMSKFYITSQDSLRLSFEKSFKYLTMLGIPIGVGTTLLAQRFILLVFGTEYGNSIVALQILVWSEIFIFMSITFANLFNSLNRQVILTKITGICAGLNVILNLILIPKYSLIGASVTTVFTEFLSLALSFIWVLKIGYDTPRKELASIIIRVSISSVLMGIFIMCFHNLTLLALVPSAALLYFVVLYAIRGINKDDINLLRMAIGRK